MRWLPRSAAAKFSWTMTHSDSMRNLRVEDALCLMVAFVLLVYISATHSWQLLRGGGGSNMWLVSFIALPMSVIIFLASLRYALGSEGTTIGRWSMDVTRIARDWLPFLLFLLFYGTFHSALWQTIQPRIFDRQLLAMDRRLFGETPSIGMQSWISDGLTS